LLPGSKAVSEPFCHFDRRSEFFGQLIPDPRTATNAEETQFPIAGLSSQEFQHRFWVSAS
jgi:hypothetical protein